MTSNHRSPEPLLELLHTVHQQQMRSAAAEVAAAIAHATGTPLNVIGGRAELIRQDPSRALAHASRIEEQVRKLADGLRQIVDYLACPEAPGDEAVQAQQVVREVLALVQPVTREQGVALETDMGALGTATVNRTQALGILTTLLSWAARAARPTSAASLSLTGSTADGNVVFELRVPGVEALRGWRLEHFEPRPESTPSTEPFRTLSICGAIARGQGGRLLADAAPDGSGLQIRLLCPSAAASA